MILYKTIDKTVSVEQVIEKSKFIAHVSPANTKEAGDAFVAKIKAENKGATHNVPAMVIGDKFQVQWASDDGEPQGTSGAPIVQMLVSQGITTVSYTHLQAHETRHDLVCRLLLEKKKKKKKT